MKLHQHRTGLALGTFAALVHLVWSLVVLAGQGQRAIDFMLHLHFFNSPFVVEDFMFTKLLLLVFGSFVAAYVVGLVFAYIWNSFHN